MKRFIRLVKFLVWLFGGKSPDLPSPPGKKAMIDPLLDDYA